MISGVSSPSAQSSSGTTTTASSTSSTDALANKNTFLQLLVAQIKNQDPMNPADGIQFVSQLAQFSQLEQTLAIRTDLDAIQQKVAPTSTDAGTSK